MDSLAKPNPYVGRLHPNTLPKVVDIFTELLTKYQIPSEYVRIWSHEDPSSLGKIVTILSYTDEDLSLDIFQHNDTRYYYHSFYIKDWVIVGTFRPEAKVGHNLFHRVANSTDLGTESDAKELFDSIFRTGLDFLLENNIDTKFLFRYVALSVGRSTDKITFERLKFVPNKDLIPYLTDDFTLAEAARLHRYTKLPPEEYKNWKDAPEEWMESLDLR